METFFFQPNLYKHIESENQAVRGNLLIAIFWSLLKNIPSKSIEDSNVCTVTANLIVGDLGKFMLLYQMDNTA
jgi:hypothetical protein